MVDSLKFRDTVIHSHSQAVSCKVLHCFGSLGEARFLAPKSVGRLHFAGTREYDKNDKSVMSVASLLADILVVACVFNRSRA